MYWSVIISGFTLGAAGSLHCIGMCGPLSLALPTHHFHAARKFYSILLYQLGRIFTYSMIGLLFGLAGRKLYLSGFQQSFSIVAGMIILIAALLYFFNRSTFYSSFLNRFYSPLRQLIGRLLRKGNNPPVFFLLGSANGLLPCGMVYIALLATISFSEVGKSVGFMAAFGAGTLPAMMMAAFAIQKLKWETRKMLRKAVPFFVVVVGLLLILRGLNLGIAFISPEFPKGQEQVVNCHP